MGRRIFFAVAFLVAMAVLTRWSGALDAVELKSSYAGAWVALGATAILAGIIDGRWWVLLLPAVTWVVVWLPGTSSEALGYWTVFGVPILFAGLLLGVVARRLWATVTRRHRLPAC